MLLRSTRYVINPFVKMGNDRFKITEKVKNKAKTGSVC